MRTSYWIAAALLVLTPLAAFGHDWAQWRGPEMNGISREKNLVSEWSLNPRKNVLWVSDIGGRAAPIVLNGRVYLNCRTAHDVTDPVEKVHAREQVVCFDAETGDVLWKDEINVAQTDIPAPRIGWASMVGDLETGQVYCRSVTGLFRCYTPEGKVVWERHLYEEFGMLSGYGGRTQTPIIDENRVIVGMLSANWGEHKGPAPTMRYYAFDKKTGALIWVSAPGGRPVDTNYSNPIVAVVNGVRMIIGGNSDGGIQAIQARTGKPIWSFNMSKRGLNSSPVIDGNYVYICHGEDNIDSVKFGRIQCIDATGEGDVTETHGVWRVDDIKAGYASPLVKDGILYIVADTGMLYAFDAKNGDPLWEQKLGTVGKGSPVWADGKLYVMEVNGNIWTLQPSREKCEVLSQVTLRGRVDPGPDEIYASPAIANGRLYFVTRDRTICVGQPDTEVEQDPIAELPEELPVGDQVAQVLVTPAETYGRPGDRIEFTVHGYDENGRHIKSEPAQLQAGEGLDGVSVEGASVTIGDLKTESAGTLTATLDGVEGTSRMRAFPNLPWKWDFSGYTESQVPATWIRAFGGLKPADLDGDTALFTGGGGRGRPSTYIWIGTPEMTGYTIQADVMGRYQRRRKPNIGITANRYNLILKGSLRRVEVQSWAAQRRMAKEVAFEFEPDKWYTMKLRVDIADDGAHVKGKVWDRDQPEPADWTIEVVDPHPNTNGSPGLYNYSLADLYYDNVIVTESTPADSPEIETEGEE